MNKLCDNCLHYSVCEKEGKDDSAMVFCDDCLHLNNFIPIEWIEAYLDSYRAKFEEMDRFIMEEYAGYEDNFYRTKVRYIEEMLKDWGKENDPQI